MSIKQLRAGDKYFERFKEPFLAIWTRFEKKKDKELSEGI